MSNKGIWIDKEKAQIVTVFKNGTVNMETVLADQNNEDALDLEKPGGAQEIIKDRRVLEREKNRVSGFIKMVIPKIKDAKHLLILGPSLMGKQVAKVLHDKYPTIGNRIREVIKSEKMTDNQLKALVKQYKWPVG